MLKACTAHTVNRGSGRVFSRTHYYMSCLDSTPVDRQPPKRERRRCRVQSDVAVFFIKALPQKALLSQYCLMKGNV